MASTKIRISLKAYDHKLLDKSANDIVALVARTTPSVKVAGPVPLPTSISRYTVLRGPHVNTKSREQFEIRTHKRLIEIYEPTRDTINALMKNSPAPGVDIKIKN